MKRLLAFSQQVFPEDRPVLQRVASLAERPEGRYLLDALPAVTAPAFFMGGAIDPTTARFDHPEDFFSQTLTLTQPFAKELGLSVGTGQIYAPQLFATPTDVALWQGALAKLAAGEREVSVTLRLYIAGEIVWSVVRLASLVDVLTPQASARRDATPPRPDAELDAPSETEERDESIPTLTPEGLTATETLAASVAVDARQPINAGEVEAAQPSSVRTAQYPQSLMPAYLGSFERLDVPQIALSLLAKVGLRPDDLAGISNDLKRLTERTTLVVSLAGPVMTRFGTLADLVKQHLPGTDCPLVAPNVYFGSVLVGRSLKTTPERLREVLSATLDLIRNRYGITLHPEIHILSIPIAEGPADLRVAVRTYLEALAQVERTAGRRLVPKPVTVAPGVAPLITLNDVARLTDALANDFSGIQLFTQLQVNAHTGEYSGAECLARLSDETSPMGPGRFVPLIEASPLAIPFGRRIFELAVALVPRFQTALRTLEANEAHAQKATKATKAAPDGALAGPTPRPFRLAVNVSPAQTADLFWGDFLRLTLDAAQVSGEYFECELTETTRALSMRNLADWMDACRALGITWSLDDFGMGYNGIDMMLKGSFETVKFDRQFVVEALASPQSETFFRHLIQACRAEGARICLEGIEDRTILERVLVFMADEWQGYYFSLPEAPEATLARLLKPVPTLPESVEEAQRVLRGESLRAESGVSLEDFHAVGDRDTLEAQGLDRAPGGRAPYRTVSFRPFLAALFLPLVLLLLFMMGLFLTFNSDVEKQSATLTKEAVSRIISAQASAVRVEQLRNALTTLSETNDSFQAHNAYEAAKALLTATTLDPHGEMRAGMQSLLQTVETVWEQRQAFDKKSQEVDELWQTLYYRMMTISALSAGANPEQLPLIEGIAKELSLQGGQIEAMHQVVSRAMEGYGYMCSRSVISSRLAFTDDLIIQCRQLRRTENDLHDTINDLAAIRRTFASQIHSMDRDAVALEQHFTDIETRDLISDIDVVQSLTARYRPWMALLIGAVTLLVLISGFGMFFVVRPVDRLLKALRAYRRQGIKPAATMRSRIREFNDMIGWLRLFVELTDQEQAKRTAIANKYSELLSEAHRDTLTGVANRRALQEALSRGVPLLADTAVLMIDIDHFKVLNDTRGHLFGDRILAAVGDVLRRNVSHKDNVYRYGGEEFCLVLTGVSAEQAQAVGRRLLEKVRSISRTSAENVAPNVAEDPLTISVGVSSVLGTIGEKPLEVLIKEADEALYRAKDTGRNRLAVYRARRRGMRRSGTNTEH